MPVYAIINLTRYNHPPPLKPQYCPYTPNPIVYGKDNQASTPGDTSPLLDAAGKRRIQQIVGSFLYYARAVKQNKRHKEEFVPPPKSTISTFDDGGWWPIST
jgi:hypothetical protein